MTNAAHVAIVRESTTVSVTFVSKPDEATRQRLKDAGYKFENGNWYRNQSVSNLVTAEQVQTILAAS